MTSIHGKISNARVDKNSDRWFCDIDEDFEAGEHRQSFQWNTERLKGRVWSKIMFCVWLAFAVKKVVAMTAELNLAWFTRYEPRKLDSDDVTVVSLTRCALYNTCLLYTSPSPRDLSTSRMPSSA